MKNSLCSRFASPLVLLCLAKAIRTFGFGSISVILALYLLDKGFSNAAVGVVFGATLIEDAIVTTLASTLAMTIGRRRILLASSLLVVLCGLILATTSSPALIICAAVFGIVSPAGYEGGPFGPIEQTLISDSVEPKKLTRAFSWYNLTGFAGAALGALFAGTGSHQFLFFSFAAGGLLLALIYAVVPIESAVTQIDFSAASDKRPRFFDRFHLHASKANVFKLGILQGLDSFGGGFVAQSLIAYWFFLRFHAGPEFTGPIFCLANVLAAVSFTVAPYFAARFGLLRTMVFTHLPCSMALALIAFMPDARAAAFVILGRSLFSSMDIPVRQAYTMLLVHPDERPAAAGITNAARAIAQGVAPLLSGLVMTSGGVIMGLPFICAGLAKSIYDTGMYVTFRHVPLSQSIDEKQFDDKELLGPEITAQSQPDEKAGRELTASAR